MPAAGNTYAVFPAAAPMEPHSDAYALSVGGNVGGSVGARFGDGTPPRLAAVLLASVALLATLKLSGWRFNVGVTS